MIYTKCEGEYCCEEKGSKGFNRKVDGYKTIARDKHILFVGNSILTTGTVIG